VKRPTAVKKARRRGDGATGAALTGALSVIFVYLLERVLGVALPREVVAAITTVFIIAGAAIERRFG
jgi:hypothetical protein